MYMSIRYLCRYHDPIRAKYQQSWQLIWNSFHPAIILSDSCYSPHIQPYMLMAGGHCPCLVYLWGINCKDRIVTCRIFILTGICEQLNIRAIGPTGVGLKKLRRNVSKSAVNVALEIACASKFYSRVRNSLHLPRRCFYSVCRLYELLNAGQFLSGSRIKCDVFHVAIIMPLVHESTLTSTSLIRKHRLTNSLQFPTLRPKW